MLAENSAIINAVPRAWKTFSPIQLISRGIARVPPPRLTKPPPKPATRPIS